MIRKVAFLLSILVIGFTFGYGGYNIAFGRHHHSIPGVDKPYNPTAYYSPTVLDYEDSPSTFALRDLAANGGNVYDYARHLKSILSSENSANWLAQVLHLLGIDILNSTPLGRDQTQQDQQDIFVLHETAQDSNRASDALDFLNGTLFRSPERYDYDTNDYDRKSQYQAAEDMYVKTIESARNVLAASDEQNEVIQRILDRSNAAVGEMQVQQAANELEAVRSGLTDQRNALLSDLASLNAVNARIEEDENIQYVNAVNQARLAIQDPYHRTELEQKQYEASNPLPSKGFVPFH